MDDVIKKNNVSVTGLETQPIIFAHGFGCDQHMWRFVAPRFETSHKVVLFDLVGSGKSDISAYDFTKYASLEAYASDIIDLCDSLLLSNVIFVGHSVSAMIGVLAAKKRPNLFSKLVLVGPSPRYINTENYVGGFSENDILELLDSMDSNYLGWSTQITPVIMDNPERPELAEELNNSFCRTDPKIARHFARVTFTSDNRADLSSITVPSLIIQTKVDAIAPVSVGKFVHNNIQNSSFVLLDAVGHCPHLSSPDATFEAINSFIK